MYPISRAGDPTLEPTKTQLPATIQQAEITSPDLGAAPVVPALIADLGYEASWRYVEFFTANIRNPHTRRAYVRACSRFFAWCEERGGSKKNARGHDPLSSSVARNGASNGSVSRPSEGGGSQLAPEWRAASRLSRLPCAKLWCAYVLCEWSRQGLPKGV
jgi:hypothetical protein